MQTRAPATRILSNTSCIDRHGWGRSSGDGRIGDHICGKTSRRQDGILVRLTRAIAPGAIQEMRAGFRGTNRDVIVFIPYLSIVRARFSQHTSAGMRIFSRLGGICFSLYKGLSISSGRNIPPDYQRLYVSHYSTSVK